MSWFNPYFTELGVFLIVIFVNMCLRSYTLREGASFGCVSL